MVYSPLAYICKDQLLFHVKVCHGTRKTSKIRILHDSVRKSAQSCYSSQAPARFARLARKTRIRSESGAFSRRSEHVWAMPAPPRGNEKHKRERRTIVPYSVARPSMIAFRSILLLSASFPLPFFPEKSEARLCLRSISFTNLPRNATHSSVVLSPL